MEFEEFEYTAQKIRMIEINDEPWFVVKDVCDILGVKNYKNVMARLRENEKKVINVHAVDLIQKDVCDVDTPGGKQKIIVVSEFISK